MTDPPKDGAADSSTQAVHGVSIDVEDYRQILSLRFRGNPGPVTADFERDMDQVLSVLDLTGTRATFFVTGTVAEQRPDLLRTWSGLGHEIGSHGYDHTPIWAMTPADLKEELQRCKKVLEDTVSLPVAGFRAPVFSVRWDSLWALDVISECGFSYDSSIVPVRMRRYGVEGFYPHPRRYVLPSGGRIVELPLSIGRPLGRTMPVAGGGYFRLLPFGLIRKTVMGFDRTGHKFVMYCHPDELGGQMFRCAHLGTNWPDRIKGGLFSFKANIGRRKLPRVIRRILQEFRFSTLGTIAQETKAHGPETILAETCPDVRRAL